MQSPLTAYDTIADLYDRYWGPASLVEFFPVVEKLFLPQVPPGACILDVCCGTGQIAGELSAAGYQVVGIDQSMRMLKRASANAPQASFLAADIRQFALPIGCDGAISTFDSLNHLASAADLASALRCTAEALRPGGWLLFDLFTEEGISLRDEDSFGMVGDDEVCFVKTTYDPNVRRATVDITAFVFDSSWRRIDVRFAQRCHRVAEVRGALEQAGFEHVRIYEGEEDLGFERHAGRSFYLCRLKPTLEPPNSGHGS